MNNVFVLITCDLGGSRHPNFPPNHESDKRDSWTWGTYEIVAEVDSYTAKPLHETISWNIPKLPSIRTTISHMTIEGQN